MENLKTWETPVLLELSQSAAENNIFIGVDDGDSGSKSAT